MKHPPIPRVSLKLADGTTVPAVAPHIISASRATDIPALFGEWLIGQLNNGHTRWINPFNGKPHYVSFVNTRCIAFWTKNPAPLLPYLEQLDRKSIGYFFQLTLNDYETEGFEPGLPPLDRRIETIIDLSERIGKKKLLWRFDPLILTAEQSPADLLLKIERIGDRIAPHVERLTVSFLSPYRAVMQRMHSSGIHPRDPSADDVDEMAAGVAALGAKWGLPVFSCAERFDMSKNGVPAGSCIDPAYILRVFPDQPDLVEFINNYRIGDLFDDQETGLRRALKDPGQRKLCGCMVSKDIGRYGTCTHGCIYCYAGCRGDR